MSVCSKWCVDSFLFSCHRLVQVGDGVALARYGEGAERHSRRRCRVDTCSVVDEVGVEARFLYLVLAEVARELIYDRANHFEVVKLFRSYRRPSIQKNEQL